MVATPFRILLVPEPLSTFLPFESITISNFFLKKLKKKDGGVSRFSGWVCLGVVESGGELRGGEFNGDIW